MGSRAEKTMKRKLVMALVANRSDLEPNREVETEAGMQTGTKTGMNVDEPFHEIAKRLAKAVPSQPTGMNLRNEAHARIIFCCSV